MDKDELKKRIPTWKAYDSVVFMSSFLAFFDLTEVMSRRRKSGGPRVVALNSSFMTPLGLTRRVVTSSPTPFIP